MTNLFLTCDGSPPFVLVFYSHFHSLSKPITLHPIPMSASCRTASPSPDNFTAIFNSALSQYQRVTGKHLETHPFASQLVSWHSPEAVSEILRKQVQVLSRFRKGDEKLMKWLRPTVDILFTFSSMLAEGIGLVSHPRPVFSPYDHSPTSDSQAYPPARAIFGGIVVLLGVSPILGSLSFVFMTSNGQTARDVAARHDVDMLIDLFEHIHFFLQRLTNYAGIPLNEALTELLGKIMAQLLSLLALSTKMMTDKRISELFHCPCAFLGLSMTQESL